MQAWDRLAPAPSTEKIDDDEVEADKLEDDEVDMATVAHKDPARSQREIARQKKFRETFIDVVMRSVSS